MIIDYLNNQMQQSDIFLQAQIKKLVSILALLMPSSQSQWVFC